MDRNLRAIVQRRAPAAASLAEAGIETWTRLRSGQARLFRAAPRAELDIVPLEPGTFDRLASNDLDLVLYSDNPVPGSLRTKELFRERFACLVRAGHPAATAAGLRLDDYLSHALVTIAGGRTGPVDRALAALGRQRNVALVLPYFGAAALAAANSDPILTMPSRAARRYAGTSALEVLAPPVELGDFGYRMVWHERVHDDPGHVWLRRMMADAMRADEQD